MGKITLPFKNLNNLENLSALLNELSKIDAELFVDSDKQILSFKSKKTLLTLDLTRSKINFEAEEINISSKRSTNIKSDGGSIKLNSKSVELKSSSSTNIQSSSLNLKAKGRVFVKGAAIDLN